MSFLFSTTPAERGRGQHRTPGAKLVSQKRNVATWCLLILWVFLITFGAISLFNPAWLQELSRHGVEAESRDYKNFGDDLRIKGDFRLALAQYQRALEIKPDYADAAVNMAITYSRTGDFSRAADLLVRSLSFEDSRKDVIYCTLADISMKQNRIEEAIDYCQRALSANPDHHIIHRKAGELYLKIRDYEKAAEAFEKSLSIQTDIAYPYRNMLKESLPEFEDDSPDFATIRAMLDTDFTAEDLSDYDLQIIRETLDSDPEIAKTHNRLGVIYAMQKNFDLAAEHFEKSLEIWPGNIDATRSLEKLRQRSRSVPSGPEPKQVD
jgi:tetratricopeptide (TPR) repeat protein